MSESVNLCPVCHKPQPMAGMAFCPFCGATLVKDEPLPPPVRTALTAAQNTDDPVKKHKLLIAARESCPDNLAIEQELLYLGRLHERNPRQFSFDVIKCYLLQAYLTPGEFTDEKRAAMRDELFAGEQLKRCQALAPDGAAFTRAYLERLSSDFIQLFLKGSNQYMHRYFGFSLGKSPAKMLADPAAQILLHISEDDALENDERAMLMNAFYAAFAHQMENRTEFLRDAMAGLGCAMPE